MNDKLKEMIHLNERHIQACGDANIGAIVFTIDTDSGITHSGSNLSKEASIMLLEEMIKSIKQLNVSKNN